MTLTMQPTKQNDMVANNNTYKDTTDKDKNKQVNSQIMMHLKNITKIEKDKKLNMTKHKAGMIITKYKNMVKHKTDMKLSHLPDL